MHSADGVEEMVAELFAFTELFLTADGEIDRLVEPLNARICVTARCAVCLADLMRGKLMEPLPEVVVVNAPGLRTLVTRFSSSRSTTASSGWYALGESCEVPRTSSAAHQSGQSFYTLKRSFENRRLPVN